MFITLWSGRICYVWADSPSISLDLFMLITRMKLFYLEVHLCVFCTIYRKAMSEK